MGIPKDLAYSRNHSSNKNLKKNVYKRVFMEVDKKWNIGGNYANNRTANTWQ